MRVTNFEGWRAVRRAVATAAVIAVALIGCSPAKKAEQAPAPETAAADADKAAVEDAFTAYRAALLAKDGEAAAGLLVAESIRYFEALKKLALTAKEPYLRRARVSDQLSVLDVRAAVPTEKLRRWSATELAADAVRRDQLGSAAIQPLTVDAVEISGDTGTVKTKRYGEDSPISLTFWREEGRWKYRLNLQLEATESAMRKLLQQRGLTEREFVDLALAAKVSSPGKVTALWIPAG